MFLGFLERCSHITSPVVASITIVWNITHYLNLIDVWFHYKFFLFLYICLRWLWFQIWLFVCQRCWMNLVTHFHWLNDFVWLCTSFWKPTFLFLLSFGCCWCLAFAKVLLIMVTAINDIWLFIDFYFFSWRFLRNKFLLSNILCFDIGIWGIMLRVLINILSVKVNRIVFDWLIVVIFAC